MFRGASAAVFLGYSPAPPIDPANEIQSGVGARLTERSYTGLMARRKHRFAVCRITDSTFEEDRRKPNLLLTEFRSYRLTSGRMSTSSPVAAGKKNRAIGIYGLHGCLARSGRARADAPPQDHHLDRILSTLHFSERNGRSGQNRRRTPASSPD